MVTAKRRKRERPVTKEDKKKTKKSIKKVLIVKDKFEWCADDTKPNPAVTMRVNVSKRKLTKKQKADRKERKYNVKVGKIKVGDKDVPGFGKKD